MFPTALEESEDQTIRIVLVGKTGSGKSATGNTILQRKAFVSKKSLSSLTANCQKETGDFDGQPLAVVDTPGLFDTDQTEEEVLREMAKCISMSTPGPHVFLVVIQPNRFTEEEQKTIQLILKIFGEKAADYTLVLFTHGDDLEEDGIPIEELVQTNKRARDFISQCGGGYHMFNNRKTDPSQVEELLKKIKEMVEKNGGRYYSNEMFEAAKRAVEEETMTIMRQNPDMRVDEARRRAELDNPFIQVILEYAASGARIGASIGGRVGPLTARFGAAMGALLGVTAGHIVATVRLIRTEDPTMCVLQ